MSSTRQKYLNKGITRKPVSVVLVTMILLCIIQPATAWGGLTHFSVNRDAGKNSIAELSAAIAPDALHDFYYGTSNLGTFVHGELAGVLYGPLDIPLYTVAKKPQQKRWATGWMTHTTADRASHGTYLEDSPYIDPHNYLSAVGADDTLLNHILAEFGADILSYWLHDGTTPTYMVIYPDRVGKAFKDYDKNSGTNYADEYNPERYIEAFISLYAVIWTEQVLIDAKQDKKPQFQDWSYLIWAYYNYYDNGYETFYPCAVNDVTEIVPCGSAFNTLDEQGTGSLSALQKKRNMIQSESVKIKMDVGKKLIDDGLLVPQKEFDRNTGAVKVRFLQTVNDQKLSKAYERGLEEAYEKRTGKKMRPLHEITSRREHIGIKDIKRDYPELYQELVEKEVIKEKSI